MPSNTYITHLQSGTKSKLTYHGYKYFDNSTNQFSISQNGQLSLCSNEYSLYLENWTKEYNHPQRTIKLTHEMNDLISMVNADFKRDFVVSGDIHGCIMIQKISNGRILFKKQKLLKNKNNKILASSILNEFLCFGNNKNNIGTVDLKKFCYNKKLRFSYDGVNIASLKVYMERDKAYVLVTSKLYIFYGRRVNLFRIW